VGHKCEVSVTGHQEFNGKTYPNTFIGKYCDVLMSWQKESGESPSIPNHVPKSNVDTSEELPF